MTSHVTTTKRANVFDRYITTSQCSMCCRHSQYHNGITTSFMCHTTSEYAQPIVMLILINSMEHPHRLRGRKGKSANCTLVSFLRHRYVHKEQMSDGRGVRGAAARCLCYTGIFTHITRCLFICMLPLNNVVTTKTDYIYYILPLKLLS